MCKTESIVIKKNNIEVNVNVVTYFEDGYFLAYCPSLEMCGCDNTAEGAIASFNIVFEEQMRYMIENNTLTAVLRKLGWTHSVSKPRNLHSLPFDKLAGKNKDLRNILNNHDFSKQAISANIPAFA